MRLNTQDRRYASEHYRIRRGWGTKAVIQVWVEYPNEEMRKWVDVTDYRDLPKFLRGILKP